MKKFILATALYSFCLTISYAQPGQLDSSFATNGTLVLPFSTTVYTPMAIQADGKIVTGGASLARYNTDGSVDISFSGGIIPTVDNYLVGAIAIQPNGKIVIATMNTMNQPGNPSAFRVTLYRYNADGTLDNTFDGDGIRPTTLNWGVPEGLVNDISIAIQSDNKIIVAANGAERFNADGSHDIYFPDQFYMSSVAIQNDGKILISGLTFQNSDLNFGLVRYNTDGTTDYNFASDGILSTDFNVNDIASAIAIQNDGKILVAGSTSSNGYDNQIAMVRYNSDGSLDNSFDGDGKLTSDAFTIGLSTTIQPDGKIIIGGADFTNGPKPALARYNADGTPDNSFGTNGSHITLINGRFISAMTISNQQLYTAGLGMIGRYQLFNTDVTTVRITSPDNNQSITGPTDITITASANAPGGSISKVDFFNGTTLLFSDATAPYSFTWNNVTIGNYTLTAAATDNNGVITISPSLHISVVPDQAPIVQITRPLNTEVFGIPSSIIIDAKAMDGDPDGTISKVDFYNGSTLLFSDDTAPYTYTWTSVPVGDYALTAKATDNTGNVTTSAVVKITMKDNIAPSVIITDPLENASFLAPAIIPINIAGKDIDGDIVKIEYYYGATLIASVNVEGNDFEFLYKWLNVPVGNYTLMVRVTDNWGLLTTSDPVHVSVTNLPPVIAITNPHDNATYAAPADILLSAEATVPDGKIKSVDFYNGTTLLFTEYNYPYSRKWVDVPLGDYTITALATDDEGLQTTSVPIHIHVATDQPPVVNIVSPGDNAIYSAPGIVSLTAVATDPVGKIKSVDFYNGPTLIFTEYTYPYSRKWLDVPAGDYIITAVATDDGGLTATSAPVHISVVTPTVSSFTLVDANTDKDLQPLYDGIILDRNTLPQNLNIRANTTPKKVGSVVFILDGKKVRTENGFPYAFAGDSPSGDYHAWGLPLGDHTLTAIPYAKYNGAGQEGVLLTIHFTVVDNQPITLSKKTPAQKDISMETLTVKLRPNPAHSILQVNVNGGQNKKSGLIVFSVSGGVIRSMQNLKSNYVEIDVSSLAAGPYFVKIVSGEKTEYKRFVKL